MTVKSNIQNTGTKFIVDQRTEDTTFGPGTTGFISFVMGRDCDYSNVVHLQASIIKRGKSGKERIEMCELSMPIFDTNSEHIKKMMPDDKRRGYLHITTLPKSGSLLDVSNIEFLGWGLAYSRFLHQLSLKAKQASPWPGSSSDLLNVFNNIEDYYNEEPSSTKTTYSSIEVRKEFINKARVVEATLTKCLFSYKSKVAQLEYVAAKSVKEYTDLLVASGTKADDEVVKISETTSSLYNKQYAMDHLLVNHSSTTERDEEILTLVGWRK